MNELPQDIIEKYNINVSKFQHDEKESTIYGVNLNGAYIGIINPIILENELRWELKSEGSSIALFKNTTYVHATCY
jgi:hypothetical protein